MFIVYLFIDFLFIMILVNIGANFCFKLLKKKNNVKIINLKKYYLIGEKLFIFVYFPNFFILFNLEPFSLLISDLNF